MREVLVLRDIIPCQPVHARGILTRYVTSPALREEMKQYKALHTLWCGGDLAPARVYRLARYYVAQYKNFAHYYFDKSKEK